MLTDTHYAVLESLRAGQSLMTKRTNRRTTAHIGPKRIPIAIVADLEDANMIRCREVDGDGVHHDQTRHFEIVDAPDAGSNVVRAIKKREPRISRDEARQQIISAWEDWWAGRQLAGKAATDTDAHTFLKELRADQPSLFTFPGRQKPYEAAFSWLIDAGILAA